MSKVKEQFVSYEIALKLKELGFNEECFGYYCKNKEFSFYGQNHLLEVVAEANATIIPAPLWQQVIDWCELNGYYINVTRIFQWQPLPVKFIGWNIHISAENPEETLECNLHFLEHFYPTKKEAFKEAILKVIELKRIEISLY